MAQAPEITANTTDFLVDSPNSATVGTDTFILKIDSFSVNGTTVTVPGLNSSYGLYLEGTVTVTGATSVYGPGTISLVLDPTNNDGSLSAFFNTSTQNGGVSFSNPTGTGDDVTLASGQFVSGTFGTQSNGQPGLQLVNTFNPDAAIAKLLKGAAFNIETDFFNTATSRVPGTTASGEPYVVQNDGYGIVTLDPASSTTPSENVPLRSLLAGLDDMQFIGGHHQTHCGVRAC